MPKPDHFDLAMEALSHQLCETEHLYVSTRLLLAGALDEIVRLNTALRWEQYWHAVDVQHLRLLLDADAEA